MGQSGSAEQLRRTFFTEQWWQCWSRAPEGLCGLQGLQPLQHKKDKALSTPGSPAFGRAWAGGLQPESPRELMKMQSVLGFKVQLGGWCVLMAKAPEFSRKTASGFDGLYFRSYMTCQCNYSVNY